MRQNPTVIFDCAHNVAGATALRQALEKAFPAKKFSFVFGTSSDKNTGKMLEALAPTAKCFIATQAKIRATPANKILSLAKSLGIQCKEIADVKQAVKAAIESAGINEIVVVCGSCFVVGEAEQLFAK